MKNSKALEEASFELNKNGLYLDAEILALKNLRGLIEKADNQADIAGFNIQETPSKGQVKYVAKILLSSHLNCGLYEYIRDNEAEVMSRVEQHKKDVALHQERIKLSKMTPKKIKLSRPQKRI